MCKYLAVEEYAFLQNMPVTRPIDMVGETLDRAYLRNSTDNEVDHMLRQITGSLEQFVLFDGELFGMERL